MDHPARFNPDPAEFRRQERTTTGRALLVFGIGWMLITGLISFFVVGFGDCFGPTDLCAEGRAEAANVTRFLPWLGGGVAVMAGLAMWFRSAQYGLIVILLLLLIPFLSGANHSLTIPFVEVRVWRLTGALIIQVPASGLLLIGSVLLLVSRPRTST